MFLWSQQNLSGHKSLGELPPNATRVYGPAAQSALIMIMAFIVKWKSNAFNIFQQRVAAILAPSGGFKVGGTRGKT